MAKVTKLSDWFNLDQIDETVREKIGAVEIDRIMKNKVLADFHHGDIANYIVFEKSFASFNNSLYNIVVELKEFIDYKFRDEVNENAKFILYHTTRAERYVMIIAIAAE